MANRTYEKEVVGDRYSFDSRTLKDAPLANQDLRRNRKSAIHFQNARSYRKHSIEYIGSIALYLALVIALFIAFMLFGTNLINASEQSSLLNSYQSRVTHGSYLPPKQGSVLGVIYIPKIGLDRVIVQGSMESDLILGPGHYVGTPLPGQMGNVGIAGHRTTYGAPFYNIAKLAAGDPIYIRSSAGRFEYLVTSAEVVAPSDNSVLDQTNFAQLTLTTCNPAFSASTRLVVFARLLGKPIGSTITLTKTIHKQVSISSGASSTISWRGIALALVSLLVGLYGLWKISIRRAHLVGFALVLGSLVLWIGAFYFGASMLPGSF